jgi:hypothetical protein
MLSKCLLEPRKEPRQYVSKSLPTTAARLMTPTGRGAVGGDAPAEAQMARLPDSLVIALWITGSCWLLAILIYLIGGSAEWMLPLFGLGVLTGLAEWIMRRRSE